MNNEYDPQKHTQVTRMVKLFKQRQWFDIATTRHQLLGINGKTNPHPEPFSHHVPLKIESQVLLSFKCFAFMRPWLSRYGRFLIYVTLAFGSCYGTAECMLLNLLVISYNHPLPNLLIGDFYVTKFVFFAVYFFFF